MRYFTSILVVTLLFAGCDLIGLSGEQEGKLELSTAKQRYAVDSEVTAMAGANEPLYVYQCGGRIVLKVQRREDGGWQTVTGVNSPCTDNLDQTPLRFEGEQEEVFTISDPGTYRLRTKFGEKGSFDAYTEVAVSESFELVGQ